MPVFRSELQPSGTGLLRSLLHGAQFFSHHYMTFWQRQEKVVSTKSTWITIIIITIFILWIIIEYLPFNDSARCHQDVKDRNLDQDNPKRLDEQKDSVCSDSWWDEREIWVTPAHLKPACVKIQNIYLQTETTNRLENFDTQNIRPYALRCCYQNLKRK